MPADSSVEHVAMLREPGDFDLLRRKDDLFAEGVSTEFGIRGEQADLQAFYFDAARFSADQAQDWLSQRGLKPCRFQGCARETDPG